MSILGSRVLRTEDPLFLTVGGTYVDDLRDPLLADAAHVTFVRSTTGTEVTVVTDLMVSGKVAQFGRGVLADVSSKLIDQFVACLDDDLLRGAPEPQAEPQPEPEPVRHIESAPPPPVDLVGAAGVPLAKRIVPVLIGLVLVIIVIRRLRKR